MDFQLSESSEYIDSKPSAERVRYVNPKPQIKDEQLDEADTHIEASTEIKYLKSGFSARFDKSDDLYALALELHDLAVSGNSEAQFYLAKAMLYCHSPDIPYTEVDSALTIELTDWIRTRCAGFVNQNIEGLGNSDDWLELSAEGKYPQSIVVSLLKIEDLPRSQSVLKDIQLALNTKNAEVMNLLGDLGQRENNDITKEAWRFLACDYGYDCSVKSNDIWRLWVASDCSMKADYGQQCNTEVDYITYSKSRYTPEEFEKIMKKVALLKNTIESDRINELTLGQILD